MELIRYSLRRNRKNLKIIGWAVLGFILLFCILTVQLSATEGQAPTQLRHAKRLPSPRVRFITIDHASTSLQQAEKPASNSSIPRLKPTFHSPVRASQASHTFPASSAGVDSTSPPTPYTYPSNAYPNSPSTAYPSNVYPDSGSNVIPDPSTSPNAVYLQRSAGEVVYEELHSTPRKNYFGIDANEACDEWAGFCDCGHNPFVRRGGSCGPEGCRAKRQRLRGDCDCGN